MPTYLTDGVHLICVPYGVPELHAMAADLGLKRCWFHNTPGKAHYDIPKRRRVEIVARCRLVTAREIVKAIDAAAASSVRQGRTAEEG